MPGPADTVLIRGATLLTMRKIDDIARGDILVRNGKVVAVEAQLDVNDAFVIEAADLIAFPGFNDTHRHSWEGQLRRLMPSGVLEDYNCHTHQGFGPLYSPDDMYAGNLLTALQCIDAGITGLLDYSHNSQTTEHIDAALDALKDSGIRAAFACAAPSRLNPSQGECSWPAEIERLAKRRFGSPDNRVTLRMAGVPGSLDETFFALADALNIGVSIDAVAGQQAADWIRKAAGRSWLGAHCTLIHCTMLGDDAWNIIGETGTTVSLCPHADMHYLIADGLPPLTQALRAGIRPSISVDNDIGLSSDMWTQMRLLFASYRQTLARRRVAGLADGADILTAYDMLDFATTQGAIANGVGDRCGRIAAGMAADIVLVQSKSVGSMPLNNAYGTVVFGADPGSVDTVMIDGIVRKYRGSLVGVDLNALRDRVTDSRDSLFERRGMRLDPTSRTA